MQFNSVADIKKYLDTDPISDNLSKLSEDDKNKVLDKASEIYRKIVEFIFRAENSSIEDEAFNIFVDYIENKITDEKYEEFYKECTVSTSELLPKLLDKMLDRLKHPSERIGDALLNVINNSYLDQSEITEENLSKYNSIFEVLINTDSEYLKGYLGSNIKYLQTSLDNGYNDVQDIIDFTSNLPREKKIPIYRMILKIDYDKTMESPFLKEIKGSFSNSNKSLLFGDILVNNDFYNESALRFIRHLAQENYNLYNNSVYSKIAKMENFPLTAKDINYLFTNKVMADYDYDMLFGRLVYEDFNQLRFYQGQKLSRDIINKLLDNNASIEEDVLNELNSVLMEGNRSFSNEKLYEAIYRKIISKNPSLINFYKGHNFEVIKLAINLKANVSKQQLLDFLLSRWELSEDDLTILYNEFGIKPIKRDIIKAYTGDRLKLLNSFSKVEYILELLGINRGIFIELALANNYNWLDDMIDIFDNNKVSEFVNIKNYLFKNIYHIDNNATAAIVIKNLIEVLKNYQRYPDLCKDILNSEYSEKDLERLKVLFNSPDIVENSNEIKSKDDLLNVENNILNNYKKRIHEALENDNLNAVKNILCIVLFAMDIATANNKLVLYGNVTRLRQLLFDNRNNLEILDDIHEMLLYASMIEDILNCNDIDALKNILKKILNNQDTYELCQRCNLLFHSYDEKMIALYAKEASVNLTKFSDVPDELIDEDMTKKYGIKVLDFTDRKYCTLAHTVHPSNIDYTFNGRVYGDKMLISLSPISNRSQILFNYGGERIALLCDSLDPKLFIKSARADLHSNYSLEKYNYNVDTSKFYNNEDGKLLLTQLGILDTSIGTEYWAPEMLCYRHGIKFSGIALPGGREPTEKEIEVAKKYNLIFVKTQELNKTIKNSKDISEVPLNSRNHQIISDNAKYDEIKKIHEEFIPKKQNKLRKIGIITDSHGLFEPTLAALEDMRHQGIDEIYSLGDNIGLGSNPKEVMDLLDAYNVKSVKGNHEEYVIDGVDKFKEHFTIPEKHELAKASTEITVRKLTEEQLEKIKAMPNEIIVDVGGEKILLTHWTKDYITDKEKKIPAGVTQILQGHSHFDDYEGNIYTIRAVGFDSSKKPEAGYAVINEFPDGGVDVFDYTTNYQIDNMAQDLEEAGLGEEDKRKLAEWTGGRLQK